MAIHGCYALSTLPTQLFDATLQLSLDQINITNASVNLVVLYSTIDPYQFAIFSTGLNLLSCDFCWTEARHQAHGQLEQRLAEIDAGGEGMGRGQESFEMFCSL